MAGDGEAAGHSGRGALVARADRRFSGSSFLAKALRTAKSAKKTFWRTMKLPPRKTATFVPAIPVLVIAFGEFAVERTADFVEAGGIVHQVA